MKNIVRNVVLIAITTAVAACASAPKRVTEIDAARAAYEQVASDPLAREAAASRLDKSQQQLKMAEASLAEHKPLPVIQHQAYLARRNAEIAGEQIAERRARQQVEAGQATRDRVLLQARTTEAERAKADADRSKAEADAARMRAEAAGAAAQDATAAAQNAAAETERLRADLAALQAKQTERGMVLTLGDVLFDTAQATLKPGAAGTLDRVATFLSQQAGYHILIEGHTDSRGSDDYNYALSERRAETVRLALQTRGIAADRIRTRGLGKNYPVASNDNSGGQQQNRRVELVFSDPQGAFPAAAERTPLAVR